MFRAALLSSLLSLPLSLCAQEVQDGGVSFDNHGQELLESLNVPPIPNAPFSLTLATEWSHPMSNGGTVTVVNSRPFKRDSAGRLYQERWLLAPKNTRIRSQMSWIQIADPIERTLLQCNARTHVCELYTWNMRKSEITVPHPETMAAGNTRGEHSSRNHEDLGRQSFAGLPAHAYRDTFTLDANTMGNDLPLVTVREYRFSPELGFNLYSSLDTQQIGHQTFTVTEITTTEPDPAFFKTPAGYSVVDRRDPDPARR